MPVCEVAIDDIRTDGGTQIRERIDEDVVADYAAKVHDGNDFPACIVFHDGSDHWLADGFHRVMAHKRAEKAAILCDVRKGTKRDALLYACGANAVHGLRRTNADKRRAVQLLMRDQEWAKWSDNKIAQACGVSQPFVSQIRQSLITVISEAGERAFTTKHGTVATMKTANIGRREEPSLRTVDFSDDTATATEEPEQDEDVFAEPKPKRSRDAVITCQYCGSPRPNDFGRCPLCNDTPRTNIAFTGTASKDAASIAANFQKKYVRELVAELNSYLA